MWKESIDDLIIILFKKNPCLNCIVSPCCKKVCDESIKFKSAISTTPFLQRVSAWLLVFVIFVEIPWILYGMIFQS
jgi:hypothetical protein